MALEMMWEVRKGMTRLSLDFPKPVEVKYLLLTNVKLRTSASKAIRHRCLTSFIIRLFIVKIGKEEGVEGRC